MKMQLIEKKQLQSSVYSFVFRPDQQVTWQPGQYMHYVLAHPDADDRGIERWFTISSAPYEKNIMITTRFSYEKSSSFKKALTELKVGDEIEADGPKGSFTYKEGDYRHVFIAGGIGITPYHSMLAELAHENKPANTDLLYANNDDNFVFGDELAAIAAHDPTLQIKKFVDKRISDQDLAPYAKQANAIFYLSGPRAMVENYEEVLKNLGVEADRVMTDYFPGY
ncbi:MAG TPA: FAD-dependent oxidoreductase [Candidatus Saccharimonadales bacterium]|nr:FAD-dependent oxidoreductase [Candidatus Saccharimonadales bacterium]